MRAVEEKFSEEEVGLHVSQSITMSMGFTAFRTPEDMYLVRGNERIPVGLSHHTPRFLNLIYLVSGLTPKKNSHRAYIAAAVYFLEHGSRWTRDVSWSYIGDGGAVFFPTGDLDGRIVRITAGKVELTRMADARVPAVAGEDFNAFSYRDRGDVDGVEAALDLFRWTSLLPSDRMVLVYWLVCLPLLRKIGTVPIVRIEGGSSSGKTRSVNLVSFLVNGGKVSSVPTAAALISRMSMSMLTIDDNRESGDVNAAFRGTLLQATSLGAREKRRVNSDTGTVTERVCGALLMNGIEPIHDGRSEIASRFLTLHCDRANRSDDSPSAEETLSFGALSIRDEFWSESVRRCAAALAYDEHFGERIGAQVEDAFGETRIGRLSAFIRVMYFAWVAGIEESKRAALLNNLSPVWSDALKLLGSKALYSLVGEELSVAAVRYAFAWGEQTATMVPSIAAKVAFDGKLAIDMTTGVSILGPMTAPQLARIVRSAGKELNAPRSITVELRAGPLEARLVDGRAFLEHAGFLTEIEVTRAGTRRFTFTRPAPDGYQPPPLAAEPELPPDPTS